MDAEPLEVAIRMVAETRRLLELVLAPPDSFDYHLAKRAIGELHLKIRVLARFRAKAPEEETAPNETPPFIVAPNPDECR